MSILLDTNVLSELLRAQPDAAVLAWMAVQPANSLFVSAVTQAQIAAIALSHRLGVATRNVSDFEDCGLTVTNPWSQT